MQSGKIMKKNASARLEAKKLCDRLNVLNEKYEYDNDSIQIFAFGRFFLPSSFYKLRIILRKKECKNTLDGW